MILTLLLGCVLRVVSIACVLDFFPIITCPLRKTRDRLKQAGFYENIFPQLVLKLCNHIQRRTICRKTNFEGMRCKPKSINDPKIVFSEYLINVIRVDVRMQLNGSKICPNEELTGIDPINLARSCSVRKWSSEFCSESDVRRWLYEVPAPTRKRLPIDIRNKSPESV